MIEMSTEAQTIAQEPLDNSAQQLLTNIQEYMSPPEIEHVSRALQLARDTCRGEQGFRTIPRLEHALAVAIILTQMRIDAVGVAAGLIFEAVDAELLPLSTVEATLGYPVARVVDSMLRLNILERKRESVAHVQSGTQSETGNNREQKKRRVRETMRRQQAETVRKMFFALADDPRVVLLKLAYRLNAMRVICTHTAPIDQQEMLAMARETREIYAPLAGRLGMSRVEGELQDLVFEILEPENYLWIRNKVETERKQLNSYVDRVCAVLREEMERLQSKGELSGRFEVSGRIKRLYSFYMKLKRTSGDVQQLEELNASADLSQIQDLIAFRILVESVSDCYTTLGHVHSLWKPKDEWIKDFIADPKPNGYRSLHTTVFCLDDQLAEIQIRTFDMHEIAEHGMAIHWHYKEHDHASAPSKVLAKELATWLHQLADWQKNLRSVTANDTEFVEAVKDEILQEQIFVFTPKGEVKDLPVGSTPLDFAYRIHSKVGDKCAGARIITESTSRVTEGDRLVTRMVPLDHELRSGDIVDIVTNRTAHPTRDWLNFAHTPAARSKIRRYLKTHERDINIQIGRERLDRDLKVLGVGRGVEAITEDAERWLGEEYGGKSFEDLLAAIGGDEIRQHAVAVKLTDRWQQLRELREGKETKEEEEALPLPTALPRQSPPARLQVAGVSGLMTSLANCCCPLPGDEIVGFISRGKGAIVHRADCQNIDRYRERDRERLVSVSWTSMGQQHYLAPIVVTARDRSGLIRDIATIVSEVGVNMTAVSTNVSSDRGTALISATLEIDNLEQLQRLFTKLEKVKDVRHIERDLGKKRKQE